MLKIARNNSSCKDFQDLIKILDLELNSRYGALQSQYDEFNRIEALDTVVIGYSDHVAAGCGCFKAYDENAIEIKRMFVRPEFRGNGLAGLILKELEQWAGEKGFSSVVLETGIKQPEAIRFYSKSGYERINNYGPYTGNSNSFCMCKRLH